MQSNVHCECIICLTFNGIFHRNRANPLNIHVEIVKGILRNENWLEASYALTSVSWSYNHENCVGLISAQMRRAGHVTEPKLILLIAQQASKESVYNAGDPGSIPGWGRSPGKGNGNPLQYSCLGNLMDRGAWWATVHGVTKESDTTERLTYTLLLWTSLVCGVRVARVRISEKRLIHCGHWLGWEFPGRITVGLGHSKPDPQSPTEMCSTASSPWIQSQIISERWDYFKVPFRAR